MGGLGSAVAVALARKGLGRRLKMVGVQDVFAEAGRFEYLAREYGMSAPDVTRAVEDVLPGLGLLASTWPILRSVWTTRHPCLSSFPFWYVLRERQRAFEVRTAGSADRF